MSEKNKDFYVWTMAECIKDTYEWWGLDMMSMYDNIKEDFPNAIEAIHKMYHNLKEPDFYESKFLVFEKVQYIYEALANLIPQHEELRFDIKTKEQSKEYDGLNMCSWGEFVEISRIDLLMAVLLFTEEFILQPVKSENVNLTDNQLTVYGTFVTLEVSKNEEKTNISILIKDVMCLEYMILN